MAFPMVDGHWHRSSACLRAHTLPPGSLYDPNMVKEQNEQHKPLPKRIQEHASAPVRDHALGVWRIRYFD